MDILNDVTTLAIEELIDNAFKQIDIESITDIEKQKQKVLGMIAKIPSKDVLIVTKSNDKIILLVHGRDKLKFIGKPSKIDLQDIVERKFDELQK